MLEASTIRLADENIALFNLLSPSISLSVYLSSCLGTDKITQLDQIEFS